MLFNTSKELYAHLDCDCFYASCEIMRDPRLRDKCVCVGGDIIITSNYNARKYGVKVGTPIWEARKMIPARELVLLPPDMNFYGKMSEKVALYMADWCNSIEQFSIDEYWANITGISKYKGMTEYAFARFLQSEILRKVGIPISIGISNTRLRAKILSEIHKPLGVCVGIGTRGFLQFAGALPVKDIPFIGPSSEEKLRYKIDGTIAGFLQYGFWDLKNLLGKNGTDIWLELRGVNTWKPRRGDELEKSITATRSFNQRKTSDKGFVWEHLLMNFERAYSRLIDKNLQTDHILITFRQNKDYNFFGADKRLHTHTQRKDEIIDVMHGLFEKTYSPNIIYRTTGIIFSGLETAECKQYSFEDQPYIQELMQDQKLEKIINGINQKFGRGAVTRGGAGSIDPRYMGDFLETAIVEETSRLKYMVDMRV